VDSGIGIANYFYAGHFSWEDHRISHRRRIWDWIDFPNQYVSAQIELIIALVAAQATSEKKDRAVVTGARNFFRTIGGAFGLAICSAILNNTLSSRLAAEPSISPELRETIIKSAFQLPALTDEQMAVVMKAYVTHIF